MVKWISGKLRTAFVALVYGLKNTEDDILKSKSNASDSTQIQQQVRRNDMAEALLKGEVTEEVEKLRDRTYLISDESKKYKVITDTVGQTKAFKRMTAINPPIVYNKENIEVKIVMDNEAVPTGVIEAFNAVGSYGIKNAYPINFNYEFAPKFKLEEYVRKMVVRQDASENYIVDLYVPKFTDSFERMERIFDAELNKIASGSTKPMHIEFDTIDFITLNAYGTDDLCEYNFKMKEFLYIDEFDGKNVLTYLVDPITYGTKITDKYRNNKLRKAYENKESRGTVIDLSNGAKIANNCDRCGAAIKDSHDYRITKETIGIGLCNKCLQEYYDSINA